MSIIPRILLAVDEHEKILENLLDHGTDRSKQPSNGRIVKTVLGFLFENISYASDRTAHLELYNPMRDTEGKTHGRSPVEWIADARNSQVRLPTSREWYQMLYRLYVNHETTGLKEIVAEYAQTLREDLNYPALWTGTEIAFDGSHCTVRHHDGTSNPQRIAVPEFTPCIELFTYVELAPERPAIGLGRMSDVPPEAQPLLQALLGPGYQEAGAVFQYFSKPMDNRDLCKVWLVTPTASEKTAHPQQFVALGGGTSGRIMIFTGRIEMGYPARVLSVRETFPRD